MTDSDLLDCSKAAQGVWLLKVPNYVKEAWERVGEEGNVGVIRIKKQPKKKREVSFTLNEEIAGSGGTIGEAVPLEHSLTVSPADRQQMFAFTERDERGDSAASTEAESRFAIVGKVAQKADCRPVQSGLYMSMKRRCIEVSSRPDKTVKQLEGVVNTYKPVMDHKENKEYEKRKKAEGKRDRKDKADVQDMLFKCFELHQYWAFIDLVNKTQQPPAFLKAVLKEIGHYNTKNPHKNTWELREEYRHYSKDEQPGPSNSS